MTKTHDVITHKETSTMSGSILLALVLITIFIVPLFPVGAHQLLYNILYTAIYLMAVLSIDRHRKPILALAVTAVILEWVTDYKQLVILSSLSKAFNVCFFIIVVVSLISQIARTERVTGRIIIESINGYMLLGLTFSLMVTLIMIYHPEAFAFPAIQASPDQAHMYVSEYTYYAFVTFSTIGYGDVVPLKPYTKSLAILTGVTGQLYVAVIIAMLVGKYAGGVRSDS